MRHVRLLAVLPLAVVVAGCPFDNLGDSGERVCTLELRSIHLRVVDARGEPVAPTAATVERADGTSLVCPSTGAAPASGCVEPLRMVGAVPPLVVVVDDLVEVSPAGETIRVGASAGTLSGKAEVVVRHDGCHVEKVSGPTEIVLR